MIYSKFKKTNLERPKARKDERVDGREQKKGGEGKKEEREGGKEEERVERF